MRNSILVRSIAAVSGIVMLASVAACGDNTTASTDSSAKSDTKTETVSGNFSGAGASSQQAAVEAWIAGFQGTNPDAKVAYNPSGSGAGVSRRCDSHCRLSVADRITPIWCQVPGTA